MFLKKIINYEQKQNSRIFFFLRPAHSFCRQAYTHNENRPDSRRNILLAMVEASLLFLLRYVAYDCLYYSPYDAFRKIKLAVFRKTRRSGNIAVAIVFCICRVKKNNGKVSVFVNLGGAVKRHTYI
jgi:hypothetical protein